jgi:hypothetical protein
VLRTLVGVFGREDWLTTEAGTTDPSRTPDSELAGSSVTLLPPASLPELPRPLSCIKSTTAATSGQDLRQLREASEPNKAKSAEGVVSDSRRHARTAYPKLTVSTRAEGG